jgi:pimeloyl-ACP methyl ester carboxylesterase
MRRCPHRLRPASAGLLPEPCRRSSCSSFAFFVHYRLSEPIAAGYSNGANMATTLLLLRPETLAGAILLRAAAITLSDFQPPDLSRKPVLLLSGTDHSTILPQRFTRIVASVWRFARYQGSAGRTCDVGRRHSVWATVDPVEWLCC